MNLTPLEVAAVVSFLFVLAVVVIVLVIRAAGRAGFCLGLPIWLLILGRRYNRGYVDGLNHDKTMAEKMGRWR